MSLEVQIKWIFEHQCTWRCVTRESKKLFLNENNFDSFLYSFFFIYKIKAISSSYKVLTALYY